MMWVPNTFAQFRNDSALVDLTPQRAFCQRYFALMARIWRAPRFLRETHNYRFLQQ
jgi:hypothetical protein